jgi:hypothetical protein
VDSFRVLGDDIQEFKDKLHKQI